MNATIMKPQFMYKMEYDLREVIEGHIGALSLMETEVICSKLTKTESHQIH